MKKIFAVGDIHGCFEKLTALMDMLDIDYDKDTLLFVAIGASAGWIPIPRAILAGVVVWNKRLIEYALAAKNQPTTP